MKTGQSNVVRTLRACARTVFSLRPDVQTTACFFASFVLCLTDLGFGWMPLGVCLLSACAVSHLTACMLGIVTGCAVFFGLRAAAAPCAVAAAVLCARVLTPKGKQYISVPAVAAGTCALVGLTDVVSSGFSGASILFLLCQILLTVGGIVLFRAAVLKKSYAARVGALCALLPGLAALRMSGGWSAAAAALAWAACAPVGTVYACAGCAAMSVLQPEMAVCFASVCLVTLTFRLLRSKPVPACASACAVYLLAGFRSGCFGFSACASAGTALALLLPPGRVLPAPLRAKLPDYPAQKELRQAARAMQQAATMLQTPDPEPRREFAAVWEAASDQVCRSCAKYRTCHETNTPQFDPMLSQNAARLWAKGTADESDLPPLLRTRCIHFDAFLTAVKDALDAERASWRTRRRFGEARRAARDQYVLMGDLLRRLSDRLYVCDHSVNYAPEISVQASGRDGNPVSGDRGAAFAGPGATYYVLLCDGMGAGDAAAGESRQAVDLLRRLLLSGADAEAALRALNGVYLLRDDGRFSTVDLLRINLTSGDAILYKWGGSASYLKRNRGLRLLGGATLPPGLGPTETAERIHMNLDRGAVLVLLSDGLAGNETRRRLEHCDSLEPRDVARSLFAGRDPGTDDCTAVAVRLRPVAQREPVPI